MRAMVLARQRAPLELRDIERPRPGPGEILVQVGACAVCRTDLHVADGDLTRPALPLVLGHEIVGTVVECGPGASRFAPGTRVGVPWLASTCRSCDDCASGHENLCASARFTGYDVNGGFAEFAVYPYRNLLRAPQGAELVEAALTEPLACCINGHGNSPVKLGDTVVVMGAGPIGLMHMMLAKQSGAKVIVSEPSENRRNTALSLGADMVVDPAAQDLQAIVLENTYSVGADVVILAIGVPGLVNQAIDLSRKRGWVNLFAGFSVGDMPPIDVNKIHYKEVRVTGTSASSRKDHEVAVKLIANRVIDPFKIITHKYPLSQATEAFKTAETGLGIKVAVIP